MANLSFSAQIADWTRKVQSGAEAVFKEATQDLVAEVQKPRGQGGRMRVDTGFLRNSLMASTASMPAIIPGAAPAEGQSYSYTGAEIAAVIAGSDLGDTIYLGYTAAYAAHREFGANGQPGDAFVRTGAQRWDTIVNEAAARVKARLGL